MVGRVGMEYHGYGALLTHPPPPSLCFICEPVMKMIMADHCIQSGYPSSNG